MSYCKRMHANMGTAVVAVGGNAIYEGQTPPTIEGQMEACDRIAKQVVAMAQRGWHVILTHGNGPQVGFIIRRSDLAYKANAALPALTLDIAGAQSQGSLGHIMVTSFQRAMKAAGVNQQVVSVISHTVVDEDDPAFNHPTKPIGSFYDEKTAKTLAEKNGWAIIDDSGRGWRRVVASPKPKRIVESSAIKQLIDTDFLVVAAGGGGIPVLENEEGELRGVEAVIDKDFTSALLAEKVEADLLVMTTSIDQVAINFGTPKQENLDVVTASEMRSHLADGQFPPGSMGPKVEAALEYLDAGGKKVLITSPSSLEAALDGDTGTWVVTD